MRRKFRKLIILAAVLALGWGTALGEEGSKGILYKTQNGDVTVYLLGSIHVGNEDMYPFGAEIQQAMAHSDTFVFECDTDSKEASQIAGKMMYYTDGTVISDVVSQETYEKLTDVCKQTRVRLKTFDRMRPWAAMTQFSMQVTAAELGVKNVKKAVELGVENVVATFARKNKKALGYLETTENQLLAFESMSLPLQEYLLDETLTAILHPELIQGMDSTIRDWPLWWRNGNIAAFAENYQAEYLNGQIDEIRTAILREYHEKMVTLRNSTMTDRVEEYLQSGEAHTYFVTVGLLHLVLPEDSIVADLQARGYTVECLSIP